MPSATVPSDYDLSVGGTYNPEDYVIEEDIFKKVYFVTTDLNIVLQQLTILINLFHLYILTRKELRSIAIYIIMIGICLSDLVFLSVDNYFNLVENMFIADLLPFSVELCLRPDYTESNPYQVVVNFLRQITRRVSPWLAISMALIRMVSVMFPMSRWAQNVTKPKSAVYTTLGVYLVVLVYTCWSVVLFRIFWLPDNLNRQCQAHPNPQTKSRYLLAFPVSIGDWSSRFSFIEGILKFIPAAIYPILTVFLILQLRTIKKQREMMKKNETGQGDNTRKLILFMTITFMLSEGLAGIWDLLQYEVYNILEWNDNLAYWIMTIQYPINNLKTLNATSHCFVCYLMSSQYREVVKARFCCGFFKVDTNKRKVIMVEESTRSVASTASKVSFSQSVSNSVSKSRKRKY